MKEQGHEISSAGILIELQEVFSLLPVQQKHKIGDLWADFSKAEKSYDDLITQRDLKISIAKSKLAKVQFSVSQITENLEYNRRYYAKNSVMDWSEGRSGVILDRIRVLIYQEPQVLPWPLRFLSKFGLKDHPQILGIEGYRDKYLAEYNYLKESQEIDLKQNTETISPQIDQLSKDLKRAESVFLEFCASQAVTSLDLATNYIKVVPTEAVKVAKLYAQGYTQFSGRELFRNFILQDKEFEQFSKIQTTKGNLKWIAEGNLPSDEEYNRLPENIKQRFERFVSRFVLEDWQRQGLVKG